MALWLSFAAIYFNSDRPVNTSPNSNTHCFIEMDFISQLKEKRYDIEAHIDECSEKMSTCGSLKEQENMIRFQYLDAKRSQMIRMAAVLTKRIGQLESSAYAQDSIAEASLASETTRKVHFAEETSGTNSSDQPSTTNSEISDERPQFLAIVKCSDE